MLYILLTHRISKVYETFGPTHQPLYQVKFPSAGSIDRAVVKVSREVYHVPPRSHFVFPSQLARMKGSDASNMHDEEVGEDEIEFSDDEAEAAYRQRRKRKCVHQGCIKTHIISN